MKKLKRKFVWWLIKVWKLESMLRTVTLPPPVISTPAVERIGAESQFDIDQVHPQYVLDRLSEELGRELLKKGYCKVFHESNSPNRRPTSHYVRIEVSVVHPRVN